MSDDQKTFSTLQKRISDTISILEAVKREDFEGVEGKEVKMVTRGEERIFTGLSYLTGFAMPNFYFHLCAAYGILRMKGVKVGKIDYLTGGKSA